MKLQSEDPSESSSPMKVSNNDLHCGCEQRNRDGSKKTGGGEAAEADSRVEKRFQSSVYRCDSVQKTDVLPPKDSLHLSVHRV